MEKRTKAELLAWIEQHQPVTREKLLGAFEDMDYEQLQGWLSELQRKRKLFEVNPEKYYTTIESLGIDACCHRERIRWEQHDFLGSAEISLALPGHRNG
jgi:uncharacterized protein YcaQ